MSNQAKASADIALLHTAVEGNTAAIGALKSLFASDQATIASLTDQVATLKAENPDLDLSGLETDIGTLTANNLAASQIGGGPPTS